jgi:crotonobetainyl-CoA:carnitine CoA-transferase CaiB-like acyl-CoA transferase
MILDRPDWLRDPRFETLDSRKANEEELDRLIGDWTRQYEAQEVMELLQAVGIPAGVVLNSEGQFNDRQVRHRGFFHYLDHQVIGRHAYDGFSFELSRTPGNLTAAPTLGQHNEYVYKEILGLTDEEIGDLIAEGVITTET